LSNRLPRAEIKTSRPHPFYFFHGEETFLGEMFAAELEHALTPTEGGESAIQKFHLDEHTWMEIMDAARTIPFFLSSWRILKVSIPEGGRSDRLSSKQENIIKEYLASPASHTVILTQYMGRLRKGASILRFFSSFPSSIVQVKEFKPLKGRALETWMESRFAAYGKIVSQEARMCLVELAGNSMARLAREIDKVSAYAGDKRIVEEDDVSAVCGLVKSFQMWELSDSLEKGDLEKCLVVLDSMFKEGVEAVYVLGLTAKFFRDLLLAKVWLKEREKDRKEIFKALRPQIQERFGSFYTEKFKAFFSLVDRIPMSALRDLLKELEEIDRKVKTSDTSPQTLLERFFFSYCERKKRWRTI